MKGTAEPSLEAFLLALADEAGALGLQHFRSGFSVENKDEGGFDPVTTADRAIEALIRKRIAAAFPEDAIVGEEFPNDGRDAARTWYVDPIDGTRSFLIGVPLWGTLLGLVQSGRPLAAIMVQPYLDEVFLAVDGTSWLVRSEGRIRMKSSGTSQLSEALLSTTDPDLFPTRNRPLFESVRDRCRMTRYGGDCYQYAMVAAGHLDLVVETVSNAFDIVPLIPILEGAGCVVTDWQGNLPMALGGGDIVAAATPALHEQALRVLNG